MSDLGPALMTVSVVVGGVAGRVAVAVGRGWSRPAGGVLARPWTLAAATAAAWVGVAARFGWSATTAATDVLCAGLIVLAGTDIDRRLLPRRLVYPTGALSGICLAFGALDGGHWARFGVAVAACAGCYGALAVVHACNPRWLGFGDVRLAGVIGLVLGWIGIADLLAALIVANAAGIVVGAALRLLRRLPRGATLPYGAFLAAGSLVAIFAGGQLARLAGGT